MARHFVFLCVVSLASVYAQANEVLFRAHPQINQKVEQFTESLILAIAPEFEEGRFRYDFSRTDLARGTIYARFDGVTSRTEISNFQIPMVVGTDIIFTISHENDKEYGLNLDLIGQVSDTRTVIDFMETALKPKCLENSAMAGTNQSDIEKMCSMFDSRFSDTRKSAVDNFTLLIEEWKKQILLLVENKSHNMKGETEDILKDYINKQISFERRGDQLWIDIDLAEIGQELSHDNKDLVKSLKLDIIRINKLQVVVSEQVIEYDISLTKLHSKSTINKGMDFGQGFQNTIEDKAAGKKIGEGLREHIKGNDLNGMFSIMMGANKMDAAWAAGRVAGEKVGEATSGAINGLLNAIGLGGDNTEANKPTADEEDLGL